MSLENLSEIKTICIEITKAGAPNDLFLVEDNFDELYRPADHSVTPREGRFISHEMLATFGAAVVTFLFTVFTDAVKDVLKKRVAEMLKRLYVKKDKPLSVEMNQFQGDLFQLLDHSSLSAPEKIKLREGFLKVFSKPANDS